MIRFYEKLGFIIDYGNEDHIRMSVFVDKLIKIDLEIKLEEEKKNLEAAGKKKKKKNKKKKYSIDNNNNKKVND